MKQKNSGLIIVLVILLLLVIGLSGYLFYDKIINNNYSSENNNSNIENENSNVQLSDIYGTFAFHNSYFSLEGINDDYEQGHWETDYLFLLLKDDGSAYIEGSGYIENLSTEKANYILKNNRVILTFSNIEMTERFGNTVSFEIVNGNTLKLIDDIGNVISAGVILNRQ